MKPEQRRAEIAQHGQRGRLTLAHLTSLGLDKALQEAATLQQILQELTTQSRTPDLPLDPEPWYVDEAGSRFTHDQVMESAGEGDHGGIVYNLAEWKPRPGYAQFREDYA